MRVFSYRNQLRFRKMFLILLCIVLICLAFAVFAIAYLDRFIVYDDAGAHLDFKWRETVTQVPPYSEPGFQAEIAYIGDTSHAISKDDAEISGFYVTPDMLTRLDDVRATLSESQYNAVLIDMKDVYGIFYYNSSLGTVSTTVNLDEVEAFIRELKSAGVYLIARIPAFADRLYCLSNVQIGLPLQSGALWVDDNNCYWMDPGKSETLDRIQAVCTELQSLGFREVVLDSFYFPSSQYIVYNESERTKQMVLSDAINTLQDRMDAQGMMLSTSFSTDVPFPGDRVSGRLFFFLNNGANADRVADAHASYVDSVSEQVVFLTESHDTRFSKYGVMTPAYEETHTFS